jgi:hypothetical protein
LRFKTNLDKFCLRPYLKNKLKEKGLGHAQVVEHVQLPAFNPSPAKTNKRRQNGNHQERT